jgi:predicted ester cyclase
MSLFVKYGSYGEFGLGTVMPGREEIRRYLIATFAALPDLTITPTGEPLSSGERVFWRWLMTATRQGEFAGMPPTGERFELRGISVLLTRGDEIVCAADCFDVASIAGQVAAEREGRWNSAGAPLGPGKTDLNPSLASLADEDNIGYGE